MASPPPSYGEIMNIPQTENFGHNPVEYTYVDFAPICLKSSSFFKNASFEKFG